MSFLSLLLFNYEFNFFHLFSLRKNKQSTASNIQKTAIQQTDLLKVLDLLKHENDQLNAEFLKESLLASANPKVETIKSMPLLSIELIKIEE